MAYSHPHQMTSRVTQGWGKSFLWPVEGSPQNSQPTHTTLTTLVSLFSPAYPRLAPPPQGLHSKEKLAEQSSPTPHISARITLSQVINQIQTSHKAFFDHLLLQIYSSPYPSLYFLLIPITCRHYITYYLYPSTSHSQDKIRSPSHHSCIF